MHENPQVRSQAQRCLDGGGPTIVIGRTDQYSGRVMTAPVIHNIATLASDKNDTAAQRVEEDLVREAFAAFRQSYLNGLREIVGEPEAAEAEVEAKAAPAPRPTPEWPQATAPPDVTPVSKTLATSEVI
jgi:hypothetical protein